MSKLLKNHWFWIAAVVFVAVAGFIVYNNYINGDPVLSVGGAGSPSPHEPNQIDPQSGATDPSTLSATTGISTPVNVG